jgi:hypothetical protein
MQTGAVRGQVEALMTAAKGSRYGHRDATMILIAFPRRIAARTHRSMLLLSTIKQLFCGC